MFRKPQDPNHTTFVPNSVSCQMHFHQITCCCVFSAIVGVPFGRALQGMIRGGGLDNNVQCNSRKCGEHSSDSAAKYTNSPI